MSAKLLLAALLFLPVSPAFSQVPGPSSPPLSADFARSQLEKTPTVMREDAIALVEGLASSVVKQHEIVDVIPLMIRATSYISASSFGAIVSLQPVFDVVRAYHAEMKEKGITDTAEANLGFLESTLTRAMREPGYAHAIKVRQIEGAALLQASSAAARFAEDMAHAERDAGQVPSYLPGSGPGLGVGSGQGQQIGVVGSTAY